MAKVRVQKLALVSELASKLCTLRGHKKTHKSLIYTSFLGSFRTTPVGSDREIPLDMSDQKSRESDVDD